MKTWQIWIEGYSITGNDSGASFLGAVEAETFIEACHKFYKANPEISYDPVRNTQWGCRHFDNEADARKSLG